MKDSGFWAVLCMNIAIVVLLISIGWLANSAWSAYSDKSTIKGLWMNGYASKYDAMNKAESIEPVGRWICINVIDSMNFEDITKTCQHEAGHELFAKKCALRPDVCFELEKKLEEKTE